MNRLFSMKMNLRTSGESRKFSTKKLYPILTTDLNVINYDIDDVMSKLKQGPCQILPGTKFIVAKQIYKDLKRILHKHIPYRNFRNEIEYHRTLEKLGSNILIPLKKNDDDELMIALENPPQIDIPDLITKSHEKMLITYTKLRNLLN
eukprot:UN33691